jgi:nucleoside-diphosphate-sugar epimerase
LRSSLDNRLAHSALGWTPSRTLREGLAQTVAWFREGRRR